MSKYDALWVHIRELGEDRLQLSFEEIERYAGIPLDHSFLNAKKELEAYGYRVCRISLKQRTVSIERL